jgi:hypothetical protein
MTLNRRSRRALVVAALLAGGLLLTGCAGQEAGSAATLGDSRITEQQLDTQVQEILAAQRKPVDSADETITDKTLSRMITVELVNKLAEQNGIVVTQGQIDEQLAQYDAQVGSRDAVVTAFAEQDVAPSQIESVIRLNLQAQALGLKLDPHGSADTQGTAVFNAVAKLSDEVGVTTSPRFGTWDAASLAVGPTADDLTTPPSLDK